MILRVPPFHRCARQGGMTLLEMLAVIVVISLIATTATVGLAGFDQGAQVLKAMATLRELDSRGRLLARTSGRASILSVLGNEIRLSSWEEEGEREGGVIASMRVFPGTKVSIRNTTSAQAVLFDRQGRSEDYAFAISTPRAARVFQVCGATGFVQEGSP